MSNVLVSYLTYWTNPGLSQAGRISTPCWYAGIIYRVFFDIFSTGYGWISKLSNVGISQKAEAHVDCHDVPVDIPNPSGGIPLSEVARHNKPHDCWIAINKTVYDLTDFLLHHPEQRNSILAWAGRDASSMYDKIPGRFPSKQWMDFFMRSEWKMGDVGVEAKKDPVTEQLKQLHDELRRLEGPSKEDIEAAKTSVKVPGKTDAPTLSEESRFPKLAEISAGKELPFFTRAEVAKHTTAEEPYMIIHNRVYNLKPLIGSHPGGDDILLSKAGTDTTKDFEVFEHSEKARVQRDRDMLVGQLVPGENTDWSAEATVAQVVGEETSEVGRYMKYKVTDVAVAAVAWYVYKTLQNTKPLSPVHLQPSSATLASYHGCRYLWCCWNSSGCLLLRRTDKEADAVVAQADWSCHALCFGGSLLPPNEEWNSSTIPWTSCDSDAGDSKSPCLLCACPFAACVWHCQRIFLEVGPRQWQDRQRGGWQEERPPSQAVHWCSQGLGQIPAICMAAIPSWLHYLLSLDSGPRSSQEGLSIHLRYFWRLQVAPFSSLKSLTARAV